MRRKVQGQPGFTLIEVLAAVALLVILLAIAIPSVMGALNHARHEADAKYERAAMALANGLLQTSALPEGSDTQQFLYDPEGGKLVLRRNDLDLTSYPVYGQCGAEAHKGKRLWVEIHKDTGVIELTWEEKLSGTYLHDKWNKNLCDP